MNDDARLMDILQKILAFLVVLSVLVVIHELGHFFTARLSNVRVLEFGVGFPPRAKVLRNKGETLYSLNWLPIGGFVKLEGEDGSDDADPHSFANARLWIKVGILLPLTGTFAAAAETQRDGALLAIDVVNKRGGLDMPGGKVMVEGVVADDEANRLASLARVQARPARDRRVRRARSRAGGPARARAHRR